MSVTIKVDVTNRFSSTGTALAVELVLAVLVCESNYSTQVVLCTLPAGWCVCGNDVSSSVCTVCHEMYDHVCVQTAEPRSAIVCTRMYVCMVRLQVKFHPNRQRPWPSFSRSNILIDYIGKCIMRSSLQADHRHGRGEYDAVVRYQSPQCQGVPGVEVNCLSPRYVKGS